MAGTWIEKPESQGGEVTDKSIGLTRNWVVLNGGIAPADIYTEALAYNPVTFEGLVRTRLSQKPAGGGVWFVDVEYGPFPFTNGQGAATGEPSVSSPTEPSPSDPLGHGYSFDTTGQTVHVTQSILTRSSTKRGGGFARDFKKAIGVTRDRVEGVDIFAPKLEFTIQLQANSISMEDVKSFRAATGKVNSATWYGFGAEEVLYLGGSGSCQAGQRWSLTHKFAFAETQTNVEVCTDLTIPEKRGWDYVWFTYEEAADAVAGGIVSLPAEAYVEQVYPTTNFANLNLTGGA